MASSSQRHSLRVVRAEDLLLAQPVAQPGSMLAAQPVQMPVQQQIQVRMPVQVPVPMPVQTPALVPIQVHSSPPPQQSSYIAPQSYPVQVGATAVIRPMESQPVPQLQPMTQPRVIAGTVGVINVQNMNNNYNNNNRPTMPMPIRGAVTVAAAPTQRPIIVQGSKPLPPGWVQMLTADGRIYYVNHNDRTTHWELPQSLR